VQTVIDWQQNNAAVAESIEWLKSRISASLDASRNSTSNIGAPPARESGNTAASQVDGSRRDPARSTPTLEFPPSFQALAARFGLSRFELEVLLLTAASELNHGLSSLYAAVNGDSKSAYPTFGLAMSVFDDPSWDALSPDRPLRYWRLIEVDQSEFKEITRRRLRIGERILHFIKGLNCLDELLLPYFVPPADATDKVDLSYAQLRVALAISKHLMSSDARQLAPVFQLRGRDAKARLAVARHAAHRAGLTLFHVNAESLPAQTVDIDTLARLWDRECALLPIVLFVGAAGVWSAGSDAIPAAMVQFIDRCRCPLFVDADSSASEFMRSRLLFEIASPTRQEQREAWAESLPLVTADPLERLVESFDFELSVIKDVVGHARAAGGGDGDQAAESLWTSCLGMSRPQMNCLAQRIDAKAGWDDIVLPPAEVDLLGQIAGQVRSRTRVYEDWGFQGRMSRGLGISALFYGESGTGKTMAAEVIANELRFDLYRIDLSMVVSKYIGDTEKNLGRLFDAAERGGVILFFDEADALFGKRGEVRDGRDRYANIEVDYLLQRMESYRGLSILATNRKGALDSAFLRRIRFVIDFPFPGPAQAQALWKKVFPVSTPKRELDLERLASLKLTGGSIHNVALHAAFLAADRHREVDMALVLEAVRVELRKLGRPVDEANLV
jgi:ATPase family protein associated with various cellular activities (AAA)/winged helix domain-containing protein